MRCIRLTLAYDGTNYLGWQRQANGRTVQGGIEDAIERITGTRSRVVASGRTDAGVHALGQVAAFRTESALSADAMLKALNAVLPRDIAVLAADDVPLTFHPIRDARSKRYRYLIDDGAVRPVLWRHFVWHYPRRLDVKQMQQAAKKLIGKHDFAAFETSGARRKTTVRSIYKLTVQRMGHSLPSLIVLDIEADGFLYNMVRNIVGSLVEIGRGARPPEWIEEVLLSRDRRRAGPTAPPQGLFLVSVSYDNLPMLSAAEPWFPCPSWLEKREGE
ncbi:MAG: tRNA pseudouridine(38-40) synthase TruA [Thermogutta sp.]